MENFQEEQHLFTFKLNDVSKKRIREIGLWMMLNATGSFLLLLPNIVQTVRTLNRLQKIGSLSGTIMFGIYANIFIWIFQIVLNIFLLQSALMFRKAIQFDNPIEAGNGFTKMAGYFKIYGMVMIVVASLAILYVFGLALIASRY